MEISGILSREFSYSAAIEGSTTDRSELTLAIARAFLATGFIIVIHFHPPASSPPPAAVSAIAAAYVAYTILVLLLGLSRPHHGSFFRLGTQFVDVVWPLFIPWLAWPYVSLTMVFQLYAVIAAACRWSLWQTLATAGSSAFLVILEAGLVSSGRLVATAPPQFGLGSVSFRALSLLMVASVIGYLVERERRRWVTAARASEQVRLGRELHDGVVQSLLAAEMRVGILRQQADGLFPQMSDEMADLQQILRREIVSTRQLIQQLSVTTLSADRLPDELSSIVSKFERDTGLSAELHLDSEKIALSPRACFEVVRIVQEALANAMRHSGAERVLIRLTSEKDFLKLSVEDDGRGFEFSGRLSQAELEASCRGPWVLQERVRSIGGELEIESIPGRCARLEIRVPLQG